MKAVFVEQPGGPENLKYADQPKPEPGPGQALVKIAAAGVNYIDVYFRTGLYPAPPPIVLSSSRASLTHRFWSFNLRPALSLLYHTQTQLPLRFVTIVLADEGFQLSTEGDQLMIYRGESERYRVALSAGGLGGTGGMDSGRDAGLVLSTGVRTT